MFNSLPEIAILNICLYLKFPDILNLLKYDSSLEEFILKYKKQFILCDFDKEINYIFKYDFDHLLNEHNKLKCELKYIRNNFFIDYTFNNENYMSYISYIDSRGWLILEYYLEWFQGKGYYELPEYAEEEIRMSESHINKYIGTMSQYHARLKKSNLDLSAKLKKYISINKNFKTIYLKNENFSILKDINF